MSRRQAAKRPRTSKLVRAMAATAGLLDAVGVPIARDLVEEELFDEARRKTGLSDFGDEQFKQPLEVWAKSVRHEQRFTALGRMIVRRQAVRSLCNRLRLQAEFKAHPEILDAPVRRPIVIASLPRTGTTLMQTLLSRDPRARWLHAWETKTPVRLPRDQGKEPDPRMQRVLRINRTANRLIPKLRKMHILDLEGPQECGLLLRNTFMSSNDVLAFPQYRDWYLKQTPQRLTVPYREYRQQLQFLQWEKAVAPEGHWVVKSPAHVFSVGSILRVMPDAAVILIHRDPNEVIGSSCSMINFLLDAGFKHDEDHWRGLMQSIVQWCLEGLRRAEAARDEDDGKRIFDVDYKQLVADPIGTIRAIYDHFGYSYSEEFETRAHHWYEENPGGKHGKHHYNLEQFGLEQKAVDEAFAWYRERHGIEPSS